MNKKLTSILLMRHGSLFNPKKIMYGRSVPINLSSEGRERVKLSAKYLKKQNLIPGKIYTSPLPRTLETAQIVSSMLKINHIVQLTDLIEADIPANVNSLSSEMDKLNLKGIDIYSKQFTNRGNETKEQVISRMKHGIDLIRLQNSGKISIAISHGDPIRLLLFALMNPQADLPKVITKIEDDLYPKPASIILIKFNGSEFVGFEKLI